MKLFAPTRPNTYTGSPLDRVSHRRDDAAWVAAALAGPSSRWVPVWRGRTLVLQDPHVVRARMLDAAEAVPFRDAGGPWAMLGLHRGETLFAVDASSVEDPTPLLPPDNAGFADLRTLAGLLPLHDAAILAHARGLMHWRMRHRFCANCGAETAPASAGNTTRCTACGTQHFPRTDPAVIMLVTHGERALLGHSPRFPLPTMYSTLAGFVEPGESLEEAVAREVLEEAGVHVGAVTYHSSQPWPFPASIMLGFHAEATSTAITIDQDEISDARWFSRAEVADPEAHGFTVPRGDSIARRLIEDWLGAGDGPAQVCA